MLLKIQMSILSSEFQEKKVSFQLDTEKVDLNKKLDDVIYLANDPLVMKDALHPVSFQQLMSEAIAEKSKGGNFRTAEAYKSALNSFNRYAQGKTLALSEITSDLMVGYENYLKHTNVCMNSVSFYMRILKAVYRKAVSDNVVEDRHPFINVYTGVAKTRKRAMGIDAIRKINYFEPQNEVERYARDMFLFSFYTRGMSFVDMAYLKKSDVKDGMLHYVRRKTGQTIHVKWEDYMQKIVDSYPNYNDTYLLPIIKDADKHARNQYKYRLGVINKGLDAIAKRLSLPCHLTMYVARHSWASIARSLDIPVSVISEAMGHSSEKMTNIYLKSVDESRIHMENNKIHGIINQI